MTAQVRRLITALAGFAILVAVGTGGYLVLGHGRWRIDECAYMTVITISTVGFAELKQMGEVPGARPLTVGLIVAGVGVLAYMQSSLTALLVEGAIGQALRRRRMQRDIARLSRHVVVAGAGGTGKHVIEELVATQTPFVAIDRSETVLHQVSGEICAGKMLYVHGDATLDHVLLDAGVDRARGVVAALTHDKDNLYVTLSARSLNSGARIVSKVVEAEAAPKIVKAGASSIVNPTMIGARRLASELIRPEVNEFLDQMLRDKDKNLRLEEVSIARGSSFAGMALKDTPIRRETRALVVAVRGNDRSFVYNPDPDHVIDEGATLIVLGETDSIVKLRHLAGA
ncbi:MAG TPA: potassium channel protein [Polyangiaceae bacterium]|nr:potassium channel protein [Polyangiaceae bacterium]